MTAHECLSLPGFCNAAHQKHNFSRALDVSVQLLPSFLNSSNRQMRPSRGYLRQSADGKGLQGQHCRLPRACWKLPRMTPIPCATLNNKSCISKQKSSSIPWHLKVLPGAVTTHPVLCLSPHHGDTVSFTRPAREFPAPIRAEAGQEIHCLNQMQHAYARRSLWHSCLMCRSMQAQCLLTV